MCGVREVCGPFVATTTSDSILSRGAVCSFVVFRAEEIVPSENESVHAYYRSLDVLRQAAFEAATNFVDGISRAKQTKECMSLAKQLEVRLEALNASIVDQDRPSWLKSMNAGIGRLQLGLQRDNDSKFRDHVAESLSHIVPAIPKLRDHRWSFDRRIDTAIDFDAIFEKYRTESRLNELLDRLIEMLEKLMLVPELDGKRVQDALQRMIDTLKKAKGGSWYSVIMTREFGAVFFKKFVRNLSNRVPVLGEAINALDETWDEFTGEVSKVQNQMQTEVVGIAEDAVAKLPLEPLLIPGTVAQIAQAPTTEIIDGEFEKKPDES